MLINETQECYILLFSKYVINCDKILISIQGMAILKEGQLFFFLNLPLNFTATADERKILIYPRQNSGLAASISHVRRFAVEDNSL